MKVTVLPILKPYPLWPVGSFLRRDSSIYFRSALGLICLSDDSMSDKDPGPLERVTFPDFMPYREYKTNLYQCPAGALGINKDGQLFQRSCGGIYCIGDPGIVLPKTSTFLVELVNTVTIEL